MDTALLTADLQRRILQYLNARYVDRSIPVEALYTNVRDLIPLVWHQALLDVKIFSKPERQIIIDLLTMISQSKPKITLAELTKMPLQEYRKMVPSETAADFIGNVLRNFE